MISIVRPIEANDYDTISLVHLFNLIKFIVFQVPLFYRTLTFLYSLSIYIIRSIFPIAHDTVYVWDY